MRCTVEIGACRVLGLLSEESRCWRCYMDGKGTGGIERARRMVVDDMAEDADGWKVARVMLS